MAPIEPAPLDTPNATERSLALNTLAMVFIKAGVPMDSVAPNAARAKEN